MSNPPIDIAAIVINPQKPETEGDALQVLEYLRSQGIDAFWGRLSDPEFRTALTERKPQVCITLGGDGTMLRAAHVCAPLGIPILGINMGRFGFLAELTPQNWQESVPRMRAGDYWLERRLTLDAALVRNGEVLASWNALNDIVLARGGLFRPIQLQAGGDGYRLSTYLADGLIVSTPTGSTAYSLACGGPILPPDSRNLLITAICPHLSMNQSVVLPETAKVEITVHTQHEALLSADGQASVKLETEDTVTVSAGTQSASFIRFQQGGYFYRNITRYLENHPLIEDRT